MSDGQGGYGIFADQSAGLRFRRSQEALVPTFPRVGSGARRGLWRWRHARQGMKGEAREATHRPDTRHTGRPRGTRAAGIQQRGASPGSGREGSQVALVEEHCGATQGSGAGGGGLGILKEPSPWCWRLVIFFGGSLDSISSMRDFSRRLCCQEQHWDGCDSWPKKDNRRKYRSYGVYARSSVLRPALCSVRRLV